MRPLATPTRYRPLQCCATGNAIEVLKARIKELQKVVHDLRLQVKEAFEEAEAKAKENQELAQTVAWQDMCIQQLKAHVAANEELISRWTGGA